MNEVSRSDDVKHFRMILNEMQKALGSVVSSMVYYDSYFTYLTSRCPCHAYRQWSPHRTVFIRWLRLWLNS